MNLIRIHREPSGRHLAVFSVGWLLSLGLIGWLFPRQLGDISLRDLCWVLAVMVPAVGLAIPRFLKGVYLASAYAALPVGIVASYIVLATIYYAVLTPVGLLLRLGGFDPLSCRFQREIDSYWIPRRPPAGRDRYFRQF